MTRAPDIRDLKESREFYNGLPDDAGQPPVSAEHRRAIGEIVARYGLIEKVGIHLIHGHSTLPENTVLVGTNDLDHYRFVKQTKLDDLDVNNVHGHIFALTDHGFRPYEYQTGMLPDLSGIDVDAFLEEMASFLRENSLQSLVALQILDSNCKLDMVEFVLPCATIMGRASDVKGYVKSRVTGWRFEMEDGRLCECKANESHGQTGGPQGHIIFNEGAPHRKPETIEEALGVLESRGMI
ncbi:hypothetical protein NKR19_g6874 [Coniochaeta hoffmannii]|uniref:Uncharacterized protein n=1 Tax=Coniochaeta hoffmannii TaxID=91930 RepID=A0AA38RDD2_9PEZI|nr:hypothetical protein NKR19_g6874 [Coniochaeta hoffmannii]